VYDVPSVRPTALRNPWEILKSKALRDARNLWFLSKKKDRLKKGLKMKHKKIGDKYFIRIKKGDKIIQPLTEFLTKNKIDLAHFHGLGALLEVEIGFYSLKQKKYHLKKYKDIEAVCILGNVTLLNNKPFIHSHIVISNHKNHAYGGHFKEGIAAGTIEIVLTEVKGKIRRKFNGETGLNLWDV